MKIATWNLLHGMAIPPASDSAEPNSEQAHNDALARLESAVTTLGVDVLGIQEIDLNQPRSSMAHHVQEIAESMKTAHWAFAPGIIGTPGEQWRKIESESEKIITASNNSLTERAYGIGLISRIPVVQWHRLELGRSRVGLPLAVPRKRGVGLAYVQDEPRVALAAQLENGFTVAVTHLSFVPFVNYFQLKKIQTWMEKIPGTPIIMGDLNLPWNIPTKTGWKSLIEKRSYPSWDPKIQFDYLLMQQGDSTDSSVNELHFPPLGVSDHLPVGVELEIKPAQSQR